MNGNTMIYLPGHCLGLLYQVIWNDHSVTPDLSLSRKFAIIEILKTHKLPACNPSKLVLFGTDWLSNVMQHQVLIKLTGT